MLPVLEQMITKEHHPRAVFFYPVEQSLVGAVRTRQGPSSGVHAAWSYRLHMLLKRSSALVSIHWT